jgi:4-hydroxybenzoate polyprenyltransferase
VLTAAEAVPVPAPGLLRAVWVSLRPHQWTKNLAVFAALALSKHLFEPEPLGRAVFAFVLFCALSGTVYLLNDVADFERDRLHPVKRLRPIAAGLVSIPVAGVTAAICLAGSIAIGFLINNLTGIALVSYAVVQILFNVALKRVVILDIMAIASGFVLRALGGAAAAVIPVSSWFILCIGLLAFFLGIEKRKAELRALGGHTETRAVLHTYTLTWLQRMEGVVTSTALMAYAMWSIEAARTQWMLATLPFIAYSIFKYQHLSELGEAETPERALLKSPHILVAVVLWAGLSVLILTMAN